MGECALEVLGDAFRAWDDCCVGFGEVFVNTCAVGVAEAEVVVVDDAALVDEVEGAVFGEVFVQFDWVVRDLVWGDFFAVWALAFDEVEVVFCRGFFYVFGDVAEGVAV